ncbi:quaternary amine ABC transporter ATP-binding protein [Desulfitobacterium chlororespirans]|uniref:Quaternary amine transport ATP-binding protein n=1 Tax=Desulfitobacterium chlororespirans DSM 11544 TaxID=1121395 RepID=A0A1M7TYH7_9FIRM|nr:glycine betaine/L-proline ABC transporter ATP-binding protein [Desulfitobacterium chlororespirans]SHN75713.1 glycine betaine/proline transport system ATP-binding protein [Desulfitobacterium chlororespirans DSM 11544]
MGVKIEVNNLIKVFSPQPQKALELLAKGLSKEQILSETGLTVGVNNVSFTVNEGEIFVIMGLSGSGKSTILRCLNRLIEPSAGSILIDGVDITQLKPPELRQTRQKKLGMVFQQFALLPHRTVLQNTVFGLEIQGADRAAREQKARDCLAMVGLAGWESSYPDELSGGMKQRVGLARALANDPDILLMDEAFSALDPLIREEMQDELLNLQQKMNKTIVFITHDLNEALKIGDQIAFVRDGSLVQVGTAEDIVGSPADDYVAKFARGVDLTKILTLKDIMKRPHPVVQLKDGPNVALQVMKDHGLSSVFVVDRSKRLHGLINADLAIEARQKGVHNLQEVQLTEVPALQGNVLVQDILPVIANTKVPLAVVDEEEHLIGIIVRGVVLAALAEAGNSADKTGGET